MFRRNDNHKRPSLFNTAAKLTNTVRQWLKGSWQSIFTSMLLNVYGNLKLVHFMGRALGLSDLAYGLWTGTAVNDTASVVAAGYAFSTQAEDFATIVKLTRTLTIIPIVLIFSVIGLQKQNKELNKWQHLRSVTPWFIFVFIIAAIINTLNLIHLA